MKNWLSWAEIDKKALLLNITNFRKLLPKNVLFLAVVKGNAYGHGIVQIAEVIEDKVDWFGVNSLDEALVLKKLTIKKPILILGYTPISRFPEVFKSGFRQVVYDRQTAIQVFKLANFRPKIHLKIETGTKRLGVEDEELLAIAKILAKNPDIEIEGTYTHFANVEESEDFSFPKKQIERFKSQIEFLEKNGIKITIKHATCTAATILLPESYFNMVRVGIGLFGLWPSELVKKIARKRKLEFDLEPVLSWKTRIAQIKKVKRGETIGYGRTYKAKRNMRIAILPIGYYDGYDRHLSNCGRVLIKGHFSPVIGRIMMNMIIVDVSKIPNAHVEEEVVLIGKQGKEKITAEEVAEKIGTINYEVVTRINPLLPRVLT